MTLSKLALLTVPLMTVAALAASCSSANLTAPKHDSGSDTPVASKPDSGRDAPATVSMDAAGDREITPPRDSGSEVTPGAGGCSGHAPAPSDVPSIHRPTAAACQPNTFAVPYDGGTCTSNSDCPAVPFYRQSCLHGQCSPDQCLTDADCGPNQVCACNPHVQAPAQQTNQCVAANCRVDSDCGTGGYCSPTFAGGCGYLGGYYCHRANDACFDATNCACGQTCQYTPTTGAFTCVAPIVCSG